MDDFRKFLIVVFGICLSIMLQILVLINGWGLEPKSWWWIIGIGIFGQISAQVIIKVGLTDK